MGRKGRKGRGEGERKGEGKGRVRGGGGMPYLSRGIEGHGPNTL